MSGGNQEWYVRVDTWSQTFVPVIHTSFNVQYIIYLLYNTTLEGKWFILRSNEQNSNWNTSLQQLLIANYRFRSEISKQKKNKYHNKLTLVQYLHLPSFSSSICLAILPALYILYYMKRNYNAKCVCYITQSNITCLCIDKFVFIWTNVCKQHVTKTLL